MKREWPETDFGEENKIWWWKNALKIFNNLSLGIFKYPTKIFEKIAENGFRQLFFSL